MTLPSLPARNLERRELAALVEALGHDPDRWHDRVDFSDEERVYVSLYRDDYVDVWLLCWTRENDTGWHDHDISSGAVLIVEGALSESSPRIGGEPAIRTVRAGECFTFGPEHIHRLAGLQERSVSIHAYSPPLWRLGQYAISPDGVMRRQPVSYAEELRPLEPELAV
jgi:Cysteine dioxygenase type I